MLNKCSHCKPSSPQNHEEHQVCFVLGLRGASTELASGESCLFPLLSGKFRGGLGALKPRVPPRAPVEHRAAGHGCACAPPSPPHTKPPSEGSSSRGPLTSSVGDQAWAVRSPVQRPQAATEKRLAWLRGTPSRVGEPSSEPPPLSPGPRRDPGALEGSLTAAMLGQPGTSLGVIYGLPSTDPGRSNFHKHTGGRAGGCLSFALGFPLSHFKIGAARTWA